VWESRGNFVPIDAAAFPGRADGLAEALLEHRIVVRPFGDLLRISVGVAHENDAVIAAMRQVLDDQTNG
jgi:histidinol-phosphate/aromatic aminotransferase/cobyric acid decarboxylase-like protein